MSNYYYWKKCISFLWASSLKSPSHDWNSSSQSIHLLINKFLDKYGIRCSMFSRLQNFLISSFWCGQRIGQVIIYYQNDKKKKPEQLEAAIWHYESFHQKKTVEKVFLSWIDFGLCLTEPSHLISKKNNSVMVMLYKFTDEILVLCLLSDYLKLGLENICNSFLMLKKQTNIFQIMGGWWLAGKTRLHKALKRWGAWSSVPTLHWHFCMEMFWLYDKIENMYGLAAQFFKNSLNFFGVYFIRNFLSKLSPSKNLPIHNSDRRNFGSPIMWISSESAQLVDTLWNGVYKLSFYNSTRLQLIEGATHVSIYHSFTLFYFILFFLNGK